MGVESKTNYLMAESPHMTWNFGYMNQLASGRYYNVHLLKRVPLKFKPIGCELGKGLGGQGLSGLGDGRVCPGKYSP